MAGSCEMARALAYPFFHSRSNHLVSYLYHCAFSSGEGGTKKLLTEKFFSTLY